MGSEEDCVRITKCKMPNSQNNKKCYFPFSHLYEKIKNSIKNRKNMENCKILTTILLFDLANVLLGILAMVEKRYPEIFFKYF